MDMTGERRIPAPRERVWIALNDPQTLKACIPGCESLEKISDTEFQAAARSKIGPISARFTGKVTLSELDPPNAYRISGEGQGGVAGFARGGAVVRLTEDGAFTTLAYEVKAQVGGKIAQLGARLVDASAKQMADQFFDRFTQEVASVPELGAAGAAGVVETVTEPGAGPGPTAPLVTNAAAVAGQMVRPDAAPPAHAGHAPTPNLLAGVLAGIPRKTLVGGVLFVIALLLLFGHWL